jgi:hypothetical protein
VKNGEVFAFVGCVVSQMEFGVDAGIPTFKPSILGRAEATQTLPTPTWVPTDLPFGAGLYSLEIPTATQVFDVASFTFTINDNAEAQNRLMNNRFAQWVKFGRREVTLAVERDFQTRAEFDAYKAMTSQAVTLSMTKSANASVTITVPNAVRDTFEVDGLSDQDQATMMRISYEGDYDATTSRSYQIVVKCLTDIT